MAFQKFKADVIQSVTEPIVRVTTLATIALIVALLALIIAIGSAAVVVDNGA